MCSFLYNEHSASEKLSFISANTDSAKKVSKANAAVIRFGTKMLLEAYATTTHSSIITNYYEVSQRHIMEGDRFSGRYTSWY